MMADDLIATVARLRAELQASLGPLQSLS
jgi:hypothetical protein